MRYLKNILFVSLLFLFVLLLGTLPVYSADNITGGDGDTEGAVPGYGWYSSKEFLWKVSVYVGKKDTCTTNSSINDFHMIGDKIFFKRPGWSIPNGTKIGLNSKVQYLNGASLQVANSVTIIESNAVPEVPICCNGNIDTVRSFFGDTGTLTGIIEKIANRQGLTAGQLVEKFTYTINGTTKYYGFSEILPVKTDSGNYQNRVPWLIIYEPVVVLHLKDGTTKLAYSATEYAISQKNGWYDFKSTGQKVTKLTHQHLPTSVQLEESWFGYPVYNVTDDTVKWTEDNIIKGGGWGMRFLEAQAATPNFGIIYDYIETPYEGNTGTIQIEWRNYKNVAYKNILCELYVDGNLVYSQRKDFTPNNEKRETITISYPWGWGGRSVDIEARINYANRSNESNPKDNQVIENVTVKQYIDFAMENAAVSTQGQIYPNKNIELEFDTVNYSQNDYDNIPVTILFDGSLVYNQNFSYKGGERKRHKVTLNVGGKTGNYVISMRVNWDNRGQEINSQNNYIYKSIDITEPTLDVEMIQPNSNYREGVTVITSYKVINMTSVNYTGNLKANFKVIYDNKEIHTAVYDYIAVPANNNSLAWFKWTVPDNAAGKEVDLYTELIYNGKLLKSSHDKMIIAEDIYSNTPDTRFERNKPADFIQKSTPSPSASAATWTIWICSGNTFYKQTYGIDVYRNQAVISPDSSLQIKQNNSLKSGYGVEISYSPVMYPYYGSNIASQNSYTNVQKANIYYPEYMYNKVIGYYDNLEQVDGKFQLRENPYANNRRVHFTPIWFPNSRYEPYITYYDVWCPAGMITGNIYMPAINIDNNMYSDWYVK